MKPVLAIALALLCLSPITVHAAPPPRRQGRLRAAHPDH